MWEFIDSVLMWSGPVALVVAIYFGIRLFMLLDRIRDESRTGKETAERIQRDYEQRCAREGEERQRTANRIEKTNDALRGRVDHFETVATSTRERLIKLEQYLKEFFEIELRSVFESFDKTVASILEEMKAELLRGVDRIEDIQAVVDSKSLAQDRVLDGEGSMYRMITDTSSLEDHFPPEAPEVEAPLPEKETPPEETETVDAGGPAETEADDLRTD